MTAPRKKPGPKGDRTSRLTVRLTAREATAISNRAAAAGVRRSEMARQMLAYAERRMPTPLRVQLDAIEAARRK
jgi:hypothetical protein